ncbi:peptide chain release factor 1 [Peptoniphilus sp. KCTC 25270]|uniref:peptide chain release factor 1 n=1 Tax=Peptoniphilus sp. KCTC 25270 TaxID=2897414 RepID=UPI001E4DCDBE|nr:peptide chain release factor 1 [Peptoniphilus sp. KCTC 25270]MCD1147016.1 peptide chain release factor 1 [Peptoniphilus sp. KCTC 25270]
MYDRLSVFEDRYVELEKQMMDVNVINDSEKLQSAAIEHAEIEPIVKAYRKYKTTKEELEENKSLFDEKLDSEMRDLVKEEIKEAESALEELENELKILLIPKDKNDDKNVILEVRGGAGGDEAALFAGTLLRQYIHYADSKGWKSEMLSSNEIGIGGYKEAIIMIRGKGAFSRLKYESGVHRVQRVPETESSGRIHTSTATVIVMPEIDEIEVNVNPNDIRVDVFRSSGNGGQSVNTTDSAVRITHIPTGIVVSCQDEKSQLKNKDKAMKILKTKLYDLELSKQNDEVSQEKKSQIGSGDRSERIRTYNYPQGRVTDHRINYTSHRIEEINNGGLDDLIDALTAADQASAIENLQNN